MGEELERKPGTFSERPPLKESEKKGFPLFSFFEKLRSFAQGARKEKNPSSELYSGMAEPLRLFKEAFHPKSDTVYYPSCALDVSPSKAFPESRVLYVDWSKEDVEVLKKEGMEAYEASALTFKPEKGVDILILLNPQIRAKEVVDNVALGGYVICNNYHHTGLEMKRDGDFEIVGALKEEEKDGHKEWKITLEELQDYLAFVKSDEEYASLDPEGFNRAKEVVERIKGKTNDVLRDYLKYIAYGEEGALGVVLKDGIEYPLPPIKKSADLYIFKRVRKD